MAIKADFLAQTPRGLLLIYDKVAGTTHLGWITEAKLEGKDMNIHMAPAVVQHHATGEWKKLEGHAFLVVLRDSCFAFEEYGGYHCSDSSMTYPTFRIYPEQAIPAGYERNHARLIEYGSNTFR